MTRSRFNICMTLVSAFVFLGSTALANAAAFFGPTPYLSTADIPAGFYAGGSPAFLEDFEDGALDGGITETSVLGFGSISITAPGGLADSVDEDDGLIDGSGTNARSLFQNLASQGIRLTFSNPLPTEAALVWTDGPAGGANFTFTAFGPGATLLGSIPLVALGDAQNTGQTAEDRFFGVQDPGGIESIQILESGVVAGGLEIDHVQYGAPVPEPATFVLASLAFVALLVRGRRLGA